MMDKKALGRGLSALIQDKYFSPDGVIKNETGEKHETIVYLNVSDIKANKYQPRASFGEEKLKELTASIKEKGVVQPVLVRSTAAGYELIAGERRLRAIKSLGVQKIPAIIRQANDTDALELSLIENIQREELNALEEAYAYKRLSEEFKLTQEDIARAVGKDRSTVTNIIRILSLPKKIQDYLSKNMLTMGHAKALLSLATEKEQAAMGEKAIKRSLSVRELENLINKRRAGPSGRLKASDQNVVALQEELQRTFGTRVRIVHGKKRGKIVIEYYSLPDLDRILNIIRK